jgi:hypothetical protein
MSISDSYHAFKCPNCQQFISTKYDACRFCSYQLNDEIKEQAVKKEADDIRLYRRGMFKKVLYIGLGISAVGAILSIMSYATLFVTGSGFYFPWSPVILLFGLGQTVIGLFGLWDERKK